MRKLTYWCCVRLDEEHRIYNIRARTKKEALKERGESDVYSPPFKVVVEYRDTFHMLLQCLGGGVDEEEP